MPIGNYSFVVYSNDGYTELVRRAQDPIPQLQIDGNSLVSGAAVIWTYAGNKIFKGLATTPNATDAVYVSGDTIQLTGDAVDNFYIVESEPVITNKVSVLYKGELIGTIDPNNEGVIGCVGETMEDDITIRVPAGMGGVKIINFTIGVTAYQAEEDMKWGGFVYSKYNTSNKFFVGSTGGISSSTGVTGSVAYADNSTVTSHEIIIDGYNYQIRHVGGSN